MDDGPRDVLVMGATRGPLSSVVQRLVGYDLRGQPAGVHRGLPSTRITVILSLGEGIRVTEDGGTSVFDALVGGLQPAPVAVPHDGDQYGIELAVDPVACRSVFDMPAAGLGVRTVSLTDVLGPNGRRLLEQVAAAPDWSHAFRAIEAMLGPRLSDRQPHDALAAAWRMIDTDDGSQTVDEIARRVGWSRRHLTARFRGEFGITPKAALRIVRFTHARAALVRAVEQGRPDPVGWASVVSGHADQGHMTREWQALAGCAPTTWLREEVLPFVQDRTPAARDHGDRATEESPCPP